ncbi:MAG TPA: DUF1326 domain-containing protein [Alphaproteobacteria bacterium]|nr:DUF1326 domain-containing protein [Alphaproteobacteria bacterium]
MTTTDWRLKGEWVKNCNCAFGCPCDFNARPTQGHCQGLVAMNIQEGHFGDIGLDGLRFVVTVSFPGPLHEGHGTLQPIIDARATPDQRDALLQILSGQHSAEGTIFHIFSAITETLLEPISAPIEWVFDMAGRKSRIVVPGVLETTTEPIRNPVTGAPHRIQVMMPEGFEHRGAEVACSHIVATRGINFRVDEGHGSLALVEQRPAGVVA